MKVLGFALLLVLVLAVLAVGLGQLGFLSGKQPDGLGVHEGRLKAPAITPNSVSSQAALHAGHPQRRYADVAAFQYAGDGEAAMLKLAALLESSERCVLVSREPGYLYAQFSTRWLKFTDDVEFWLDETAGVIHVRSASRLGRKDFGVNRVRVEALRKRFVQSMEAGTLRN